MAKFYRNGDVYLFPGAKIPKEAQRMQTDVIQYGEATGHAHRITSLEDAEILQVGEKMFLRVSEKGVSIVHEDHKPPLFLPQGDYAISIDREYDYSAQAIRKVSD